MEAYYYQRLDREQRSVYHAMEEGLRTLSPSFPVPRLDGRLLAEIFLKLRLDCPDIFYAVSFSYRYAPGASNVTFLPEYLFDKSKIREHQKAMSARVAKLSRPAQALAEREKEQYIHDFICQNVHYDKLKKPYSHEIIGPLGQGVGVCEGIAKSVKVLCDALGLWCVIAISDAAPEKGVKYRHTWNILRLDGRYFHLDATFDNSLGRDGVIRYDYFNLDDRSFFRDHEPAMYPVPPCTDGDRFYYREKRRSFTKQEDVCRRAQQAMRKGLPLVFHWRGGYLTREVLGELVKRLEETARQKGMHACIALNWSQAVLRADFTREPPGREVVAEQANEGEHCAATPLDGLGPPCDDELGQTGGFP